MGQFSWFTQDTKVQIFNDWREYGDKQTIHMVDPRDGHDYKEEAYEGYGIFGGRDFYELLADLNKDLIIKVCYGIEKDLEIFNKKFEDLTSHDIDIKRHYGISLWFDYIKPKNWKNDHKMEKLPEGITWSSPILVEDYNKWQRFKNSYPESDPDQGWHIAR